MPRALAGSSSAFELTHLTEEDVLDDTTDITYLYLTFSQAVPTANTTLPASTPTTQPPPAPDLSAYGDPREWPLVRKRVTLGLACTATIMASYTAGAYAPAVPLMRADLDAPSDLSVLGGVTTFCLGFALAPMALAPLSETYGRYPIFVASGVVFVVFQAVGGVVRDLAAMLAARFFLGVGASVFSSVVGGVLADMYAREHRNTAIAVFSGAVMVGTGVGPLVGSFMTGRLGRDGQVGNAAPWKWIFWHQVIMNGLLLMGWVFFFRESRGSVLLSRKARALNAWYEGLETAGYFGVWADDFAPTSRSYHEKSVPTSAASATPTPGFRLRRIRWRVKEDEERASLIRMMSLSLGRPFHLLFTEPVVFFFSLWVAFAWAVLYLTFATIPLVFGRRHGWDVERSGHVFGAIPVGAALATALGVWQERALRHPAWQPGSEDGSRLWAFLRRRLPADAPEARLYFTCLTSCLLPAGLFLFGFASANPASGYVAPAAGVAVATAGIYSIYLAAFNYMTDAYHRYASSALAAQCFCRNVLGGVFPLVAGFLFTHLGEARAGALLGGVATALTVVPWALVFWGKGIRARSRFASVSPPCRACLRVLTVGRNWNVHDGPPYMG